MEQSLKKGILNKMTTTTEIPVDYIMQEVTEAETGYKIKPDVPIYSQVFELNGQIEAVRKYVDRIGAKKIKPSSPETNEEIYQKGFAFIGIHPSRDFVSVSGVEKEVIEGFEKIVGGKIKMNEGDYQTIALGVIALVGYGCMIYQDKKFRKSKGRYLEVEFPELISRARKMSEKIERLNRLEKGLTN